MRAKYAVVGIALLVMLACALLLLSGKRVLVHEVKVNPGDRYVLPGHGDLGSAQQASLVCRYFTGRSILTSVFWYALNNLMGKDQCPFITSEG